MRRICVYCGSNPGVRQDYALAAGELGRVLVRRGLELVYGGSSKGIMGILADGVLELGG
jgi:predicted Rossmann-fold nucleotide-binding protein